MGRKTKVNRTTTPELVAQCNPENLKLKHDFLNYLASIQRSEGTIYNYNSDLNIFLYGACSTAETRLLLT